MGNDNSKTTEKQDNKINKHEIKMNKHYIKTDRIPSEENIQKPKENNVIQENPILIDSDILVGKEKGNPSEYYTILSKLGEGYYGEVWKARNKFTGAICAIKKIIKKRKTTIEEEIEIINEIEMMKKIDHPNIIKIFQFFSTSEAYFLVVEYCEGGELFNEIIKDAPFTEEFASFILYQILSAVFYCHSINIINRDIKPENILIERREKDGLLRVKVCDFGTAKIFEKGRVERKIVGSSYYIAPEVLQKKYDEKCDLWSCGVIMYILLSGRPPFGGPNDQEVLQKVRIGSYDLKKYPWTIISKEAKNLIENLLKFDPLDRLSAGEALKHPWFKKTNAKSKVNQIVLNPKNEKLIENFIYNLQTYNPNGLLQQAALAYLVHNSPQMEEIENACKLFNRIDLNNDGRITKEELLAGLEGFTSQGMEKLNAEVEQIFKNIDTNYNGYIEFEEFVRGAINKETLLTDDFLLFAFRFFDTDNSGEITYDEIKERFCQDDLNRDNPILEQQLKKIIGDIDLNNDGKISFEEFKIMMCKILKKAGNDNSL